MFGLPIFDIRIATMDAECLRGGIDDGVATCPRIHVEQSRGSYLWRTSTGLSTSPDGTGMRAYFGLILW